jgi:hypothetical protein
MNWKAFWRGVNVALGVWRQPARKRCRDCRRTLSEWFVWDGRMWCIHCGIISPWGSHASKGQGDWQEVEWRGEKLSKASLKARWQESHLTGSHTGPNGSPIELESTQ